MKTKRCSGCKEYNSLDNFGKSQRNKDGLNCYCKDCRKQRDKVFRQNHKESETKRVIEWQRKNPEIQRQRMRDFRKNHKERLDKERIERYKNDIDYRLTCLLRKRIRDAVYFGYGKKNIRTIELLDCSIKRLKEHLQKTAIINGYLDFDINKYSGKEYHIDHIIPCASFDLSKEEEQRKCFHWSNLQILTSEENLIKGDKLCQI